MCGNLITQPLQAIGLLPDPPKPPKVEQIGPPPQQAPAMSDPAVARAQNRERVRLAAARGRQSTILTSPQGTTSVSPTAPVKTLLGS